MGATPLRSSSSVLPPPATHPPSSYRRKDMSWRKPAPKFIPSPPPSPPPSSPANRLLPLSETTVAHGDVPPLPVNWREAIESVLTKDRWQRHEPMVAYGGSLDASVGDVWTRPTSPTPYSRWDIDSTGFVSPSASTLDLHHALADKTQRYANIYHHEEQSCDVLPSNTAQLSPEPKQPRRNNKHLHRVYRPPTPPLPTHYRKRRLPDDDVLVPIPLVEPYHRVYPDTPSVIGHCDTVALHSLAPSTLNLSYATLPRTHSTAAWDVPVLPVVLSGPRTLKKAKSNLSLTNTVARTARKIIRRRRNGSAFQGSLL